MPKLILKGLTFAGGIELSEGLVSIGRNPTNDFRISDPTVSSFHCELEIKANRVLVRDLGSTNGTYIDDLPIQEATLDLKHALRLGSAEMRLELESPADSLPEVRIPKIDQPEPRPQPSAPLPDGRLPCHTHPQVAAVMRCTACQHVYCQDCVKSLSLTGAQPRFFCPACSQPCLPIYENLQEKKPSFLGRLTQTIRIRLSKR